MLACVSMSEVHVRETIGTLQYASRTRTIQNKVVANVSEAGSALLSNPDLENSIIVALRQQVVSMQLQMQATATATATAHTYGESHGSYPSHHNSHSGRPPHAYGDGANGGVRDVRNDPSPSSALHSKQVRELLRVIAQVPLHRFVPLSVPLCTSLYLSFSVPLPPSVPLPLSLSLSLSLSLPLCTSIPLHLPTPLTPPNPSSYN